MSAQLVDIVGSYLSPYVRKVLVCLDLKGIDYRIDPVVPFYGNQQFSSISPLRRIPVLIDGAEVLSDSTVICEYLEEKYPSPALYPAAPYSRARARWFEEFADTRMGEVFIWRFFNEIVIRRFVWGEETDEAVVENTRQKEIPQVLDYLEGELSSERDYLLDEFGIADIAVATFFRNAEFVSFTIDEARWPLVAGQVRRTLDQPSFRKLRRFEEILLKTPIQKHREALAAAGAPLTPTSCATESPRRGVLST